MQAAIIAVIVAAGILGAGSAGASETLAKSNGCLTCHAVDAGKMAPSFKSIAARYKGDAAAEGKLAQVLATGKGHPQAKAKEEEITTLVKWVLAQ